MEVCLVEPKIPPNTGNIARLCAALGISLHLVEPLGFEITDKTVRRAGLDYWPLVCLQQHLNLESFLVDYDDEELFFFSTRAETLHWDADYQQNSVLVFGNEIAGLPASIHRRFPDRFFRIPMLNRGVRSLNLSSAVAIAVYEALRQLRRGR